MLATPVSTYADELDIAPVIGDEVYVEGGSNFYIDETGTPIISGTETDVNGGVIVPATFMEIVQRGGGAYFRANKGVKIYGTSNTGKDPVYKTGKSVIFYADKAEFNSLRVWFALEDESVHSGWIKDKNYTPLEDVNRKTAESKSADMGDGHLFIAVVDEEKADKTPETTTNETTQENTCILR